MFCSGGAEGARFAETCSYDMRVECAEMFEKRYGSFLDRT